MSIASEITSIGENLKKDYQAIANLGADLTNVDKNIENIAELLDGVYDNLPKTSYQEGTEINLGVTSKGKLDFENGVVGIGQTEQDGEPTPSTPIAINSVTGNQDVVVKDGNNNTIATYQLSLGDIELNAIGNYKDELIYDVDEDKVYKNEKIGKVVLNGSETGWQFYSDSRWKYRITIAGIKPFTETGDQISTNIKNNYFTPSYWNNTNNNGTYVGMRDINTMLSFAYTGVSSLAEWKSWLETHNITQYYVLNEATTTKITDTTLINQVKALYNALSNTGTTIITSNGNLPMIIKVRGLKGE